MFAMSYKHYENLNVKQVKYN